MASKGFTSGAGRVGTYDPAINPAFRTGLWKDCPLAEYQHDPSIGLYIHENWTRYEAGGAPYTLTQATTGAATKSTAASGVLEIDSNSTTATQGATLQHQQAVIVPVAGSKIWAQFAFKIVDTFDKAEIFVGLSELDTTLIATSANSSANHIGWECVTDNGVLLFTSEKAGAGATKAAATIAEATYIELGLYVDGVTSVAQYINDVLVGTAHVTANVPIVALYPSFVCQSGGTNDPIMHVKPYHIFQLYA